MARMMFSLSIPLAFTAGLILMAASPFQKNTPLRIGVVNVLECSSSKWHKGLLDRLKKLDEKYQKTQALLTKKIMATQDKMGGLPKGSKLRYSLLLDQQKLQLEKNGLEKSFRLEYRILLTQEAEPYYRRINSIAADIGKREGFDFILSTRETPYEEDANKTVPRIQQPMILYNNPRHDITAEVIRVLDEEYAIREKNNPPTATALWSCPACKEKAKVITEEEVKKADHKCNRCGGKLQRK